MSRELAERGSQYLVVPEGVQARARLPLIAVVVVLAWTLGTAVETGAGGPPAGVTSEESSRIEEQIQGERYVVPSDRPGSSWQADLPHGLTVHFGREGILLGPRGSHLTSREPAWELGLRLAAWGTEQDMQAVDQTPAVPNGNGVEYRHGPLTVRYSSTPLGLAQDIIIDAPPQNLVLKMVLSGDLTAVPAPVGNAVTFQPDSSGSCLRYSDLAARDAAGATLDPRVELGMGGKRLLLVVSTSATTWPVTVSSLLVPEIKLLPNVVPDTREAHFGLGVAVDGEYLIVGLDDPEQGEDSGAAHIYRREQGTGTWEHVTKIIAVGGVPHDDFASSVAISGDIAVVGAPGTNYYPGAAYIFQRNHGGPDAWGQVARLTPPDSHRNDRFGYSVAVSGDTAVIGASEGFFGAATVHIYQRDHDGADTWGLLAEISPDSSGFGKSVAIDGDIILIGAPAWYDDESQSGAVLVLQRDQGGPDAWGQLTRITAEREDAHLGNTIALSDDTALVMGGYAAYVFRRDQGGPDAWGQVAELTPTGNIANDHYGQAIAINGDTAVIGAPYSGFYSSYTGAVYLFQRDQGGPDAWGQLSRLTAEQFTGDVSDYQCFGWSVALSGDTALVGVINDDEYGQDSGAVYDLGRDQGGPDAWGQVAKLSPPPVFSARYTWFGKSVAMSGDIAVVGASRDSAYGQYSGAVYLYQRDQGGSDTWGRVVKITPADGAEGDAFGVSVSISDDTAIVGAAWDDDNGSGSGSAYIFQRDESGLDAWGQIAKIVPADGSESTYFGDTVAISGDTAVVGASQDDANGVYRSGSAYVFQRDHGGTDAWGQVVKITPADGAVLDRFGYSVAISGDTAVITAILDDDSALNSGSAYFFERDHGGPDAWGQIAKITPADGEPEEDFGISVAINGDTAFIGAQGEAGIGTHAGSVYVFERDRGGPGAWGLVTEIIAADGAEGDFFGSSVAIDGDTAAVGAYRSDDPGALSGSVYVFKRSRSEPGIWSLIIKLGAWDGGWYDELGTSVAVSDGTIFAGAPLSNSLGEESGAVHVFALDTDLPSPRPVGGRRGGL